MSHYNYEHLKGREWDFGDKDCLGIIRSFYDDLFNIHIPNYARPNLFWRDDTLELYSKLAHKNGFRVLECHPSEYQFGDLILMAIQATKANHAAILVEGNQILHHLYGQISATTPYGGMYRNGTLAVMRHKDVVLKSSELSFNILDTLSPARRRKVEEEIERLGSAVSA